MTFNPMAKDGDDNISVTVSGVGSSEITDGSVVTADLGDLTYIPDSSGNEVLEFEETASAVNHIGIDNAATGLMPQIIAKGEADTGIIVANEEDEEIVILDSVATSVNEFTISSAAAGTGPQLAATGTDANIDVEIIPKGTGDTVIGTGAATATLASEGNFDLELITGNATSGALTLTDGAAGALTWAPSGVGSFDLTVTDDGAAGATLNLGQVSTTAAANDVVGQTVFRGSNSTPAQIDYCSIDGVVVDPTAGAEFGEVKVYAQNGTASEVLSATIKHDGANGIVEAGDAAAAGVFQSDGDFDVTLRTGNATTGSISIVDGANGNIAIAPDGSGVVQLTASELTSTSARNGTAGTSVTAVEYGDGTHHTTVLTLTACSLGAPNAGANSAVGALIYTLPAGVHLHSVSYMDVGLTIGTVTTDTPDVGIGSLIGSGVQATLDAVGATAEDYVTGQTWNVALIGTHFAAVGPLGATAGVHTGISLNGAADSKAVNLNAADGWAAGITGNLTADGTIVLKWSNIV